MLPPALEMPASLVQITVVAAVEDIAASILILVRWASMVWWAPLLPVWISLPDEFLF